MKAPIALFVYNRIEHTKHVLKALDKNKDADKSDLYIFSDAPRDNSEKKAVDKVRQYIEGYSNNSRFKKVKIIYAKENKGISASLIEGINRIINEFGRIIVLEDDIVTSPDFIVFMNKALDYYENDFKVWSISGFSPNLKGISKCKTDVFCGCRGYCWGWATWKDRFVKVDWNVKDYDIFIDDKKAQREFNRGGLDMTPLLKMQHEGKVDSWAIRWCYQEYKESMLTIFPRNSKVQNIGFDGSGTNSGRGDVFSAELKEEQDWDFSYDEKDDKTFSHIRDYHSRLYIRQIIGRYWYQLTEYEYCLAYRLKDEESQYKLLKPDFIRWYADPIPFSLKGEYYVFMEIYNKWKKKGYIGVSNLGTQGKLGKPIKIIEEPFHLSFPNIFSYKEKMYLIPESGNSGQIRIYEMVDNNIYDWNLYYTFNEMGNIVDIVPYENQNGDLFFLGSEVNEDNKYQTRLLLYKVESLENVGKIKIRLLWKQEEYTYSARNGGNIIHNNGLWRVAQHSTKDIYGKFISFNKIGKLNEQGLKEEIGRKLTSTDISVDLPDFIYRIWGMHTYGQVGMLEVVDLLVQRFSVGGLLIKLCRRFKI